MSIPEPASDARECSVSRTELKSILALRERHRQEMDCQIIQDSFPYRGLSDPYEVRIDGQIAGYGLVANQYYRDAVTEFYLIPAYRRMTLPVFRQLLDVSAATHIRTQTNDSRLLLMLYDFSTNIVAENVLFVDALTTSHPCPGGVLRRVADSETEEWVIEWDGNRVASGGILFHYNPPYGDIYMSVEEPYRQRGFGSYLVQELKRICYATGKIPAARCDAENVVSRKTLEKAGMLPCGRVLQGEVKK